MYYSSHYLSPCDVSVVWRPKHVGEVFTIILLDRTIFSLIMCPSYYFPIEYHSYCDLQYTAYTDCLVTNELRVKDKNHPCPCVEMLVKPGEEMVP